MTLEAAIHVVEHSSSKTDNNIHNGRESRIWSTESNRKLQQGTQSGMALCRQRPHKSSIKSWLWDFPWPSGPTRFLPHNWNKHRTPQNKRQVQKSHLIKLFQSFKELEYTTHPSTHQMQSSQSLEGASSRLRRIGNSCITSIVGRYSKSSLG